MGLISFLASIKNWLFEEEKRKRTEEVDINAFVVYDEVDRSAVPSHLSSLGKLIKWKEANETQNNYNDTLSPVTKASASFQFEMEYSVSEFRKKQEATKLEKFLSFAALWCGQPKASDIPVWFEFPTVPPEKGEQTYTINNVSVSFGTFKTSNVFVTLEEPTRPCITDGKLTIKVSEKFWTASLYFKADGDGQFYCLEWKKGSLSKDVAFTVDSFFITTERMPFISALSAQSALNDVANGDIGAKSQKWIRSCCKQMTKLLGSSDIIEFKTFSYELPRRPAVATFFLNNNFKCRFSGIKSEKALPTVTMGGEYQELYLYEVLRSRGLKVVSKLDPTTLAKLLQKSSNYQQFQIKSYFVKRITDLCDQHFVPWYLVNLHKFDLDLTKLPANRFYRQDRKLYVKKAIITPSSIRYLLSQPSEMNRILDENRQHCDSFMTVVFRDEDFVSKMENMPDELIKPCIADRLYNGLEVAGKTFRYLGGSNSQLKEHSCYLHTVDSDGHNAEWLREQIGDLKSIRNPAKYVKRLGMAFSSSKGDRGFKLRDYCSVTVENDVECTDPATNVTYCFSDGIGKISKKQAEEVYNELYRERRNVPTAFQMRLGGAKGVLAVCPKLSGYQIILRKSMVKFKSQDRTLYVQDISLPKKLCLNHQIVTLLSQNGIPDEVFFKLQENEICKILDKFRNKGEMQRKLNNAIPFLPWKNIVAVSDDLTEVSLFRHLLKETVESEIYAILNKARIFVKDGHQLMGVLDETATLEYGEVYFSAPGTQHRPFVGDVIVSKMPCLHPGDVRKFKAVNKPGLHYTKNVIVFPQKGKRPHPDEMAGSDLDGDLYWVTWHPGFVTNFRTNETETNYPAMDYLSTTAKDHPTAITEKDMIDFIIHFIQTDITSRVSRAHLCMADRHREGIFSDESLKLAELHSKAVDAPKTGDKVAVPDELMPKSYPDFLNKGDHKVSYGSNRILGKLFRQYKDLYEAFIDMKSTSHGHIDPVKWFDPVDLISSNTENIKSQVKQLHDLYVKDLNKLQQRYGLNEIELLAGNVFASKSNTVTRADPFVLRREIEDEMKLVKERVLKELRQTMKGLKSPNISDMLIIAFNMTGQGLSLSFPWFLLHSINQRINALSHLKEARVSKDANLQPWHYHNGKAMVGILLDGTLGMDQLTAFITQIKKHFIQCFNENMWLYVLFIYYSLALNLALEHVDRQKMNDLALLIVQLVDPNIGIEPPTEPRRSYFQMAAKFLTLGQDTTVISSKILNKLIDIQSDAAALEMIGSKSCSLLLSSLKKSDSGHRLLDSHPLANINCIHRSNVIADMLVNHKPMSLIKQILTDPKDSQSLEITLTPRAYAYYNGLNNNLRDLSSSGLKYWLDGHKIVLIGHRILLQKATKLIEPMNIPDSTVSPPRAQGFRRSQSNDRDMQTVKCNYCKNLGHMKNTCPKLRNKSQRV